LVSYYHLDEDSGTFVADSSGNGSGATVGYTDPLFREPTIVHGGKQSMPLDWAEDPVRRREVGIPEEVAFRTKLGMDHFEMRSWRGIHRHWYLTQVRQLFCARLRQQQREKKRAAEPCPDGRTNPPGGLCVGASAGVSALRPHRCVRTGGRADPVLPAEESTGSYFPLEENPAKTPNAWDRCPPTEVLYTG
jgi:hypothetical protein